MRGRNRRRIDTLVDFMHSTPTITFSRWVSPELVDFHSQPHVTATNATSPPSQTPQDVRARARSRDRPHTELQVSGWPVSRCRARKEKKYPGTQGRRTCDLHGRGGGGGRLLKRR